MKAGLFLALILLPRFKFGLGRQTSLSRLGKSIRKCLRLGLQAIGSKFIFNTILAAKNGWKLFESKFMFNFTFDGTIIFYCYARINIKRAIYNIFI